MTTVFNTTTNVSKLHKQRLGDICVHYSSLEQNIARTIWLLRGETKKIGRVKTSDLMMKDLLTEFRKEVRKRFGPAHPAYEFYIKIIADGIKDAVCPLRNHYVHGLWAHGLQKGMKRKTYVVSYFKSPGRFLPASLAELDGLRRTIETMAIAMERRAPTYLNAPLP